MHTLLEQYESALNFVKSQVTTDNVSPQEVIGLFKIRDEVQIGLSGMKHEEAAELERIVRLDKELQELGPRLANATDLTCLVRSFTPSPADWWWHFERRERKTAIQLADVLWNGLSAAVLAITASYVVMMVQALSTNGMGLEEVFTTILQGAGLAVIGKGTLTTNGRKHFHSILNRMKIKQAFHSLIFFSFSAMLLAVVSVAYHRLDTYFYEKGVTFYSLGQLTEATEAFQHALVLDPKNSKVNTALGLVHESLGNVEAAVKEYEVAVEEGLPEGFNDLGHALIHNKEVKLAETYLRMGLQRIYSHSHDYREKVDLRYKLHRNLGWSLLEQQRYDEAMEQFELAISLDHSIPEDQIGGGMAYCLLAHTLELNNEKEAAQEYWQFCRKHARPETIGEYTWLTGIREGDFTNCIDTNSIVTGIDLKYPANELTICQEER